MKTLLTGGVVVTCDDAGTIHAPGDVLLSGDRIAYVGPRYDGEVDMRISMSGRLLLPGLINAHTHTPMTLFRGLSDDVDLMVFLSERVWPREMKLTPDEAYAGSVLAGIEMLKSGVTTYADMYFYEDALARAAVDAGIRALISPAIFDIPAWVPILGAWERRLSDVLDFCKRWEGHRGLIHTGLGPHAPYTVPLPVLKEIAAAGREADVPVNIHLVETKGERDTFNAQGIGSTAVALEEIGFFEGRVLAAHNVWLDDGDLAVYQRHNVGVAHCPQSNSKLGAGIAPLTSMLAAGLNVGLGTDGAATNNNLDLWEEIRMASLLAKASSLDPKVVTARQSIDMATSMGARAIHLPDIGMLREGYRADVVALTVNDTVTVPVFSPESYIGHLAYSIGREAVESVWVNGQKVVGDRQVLTLDEAEARRAAQEAAMAVAARVAA